jgi:hypothetical protein
MRAELVAFQASAMKAAGVQMASLIGAVLGGTRRCCRGDYASRKGTIITMGITMARRCGWRRSYQLTLHHDLIRLITGTCASNPASQPH